MSSAFFSKVTKWVFPRDALDVALAELRLDGDRSTEGIALWLGDRKSGVASVSHMVYLRGSGLFKTEYHIRVSPNLINEVTDSAINLGKTLIGQIHSHPADAGVGMSPSDEAGTPHVPYYLSVVVPDLALRDRIEIADCGVHVFDPRRGFRRLSQKQVRSRIAFTAGETVQRITLGF
jgi:hypothetical protein